MAKRDQGEVSSYVLKRSSKKERQLKYDFMPSLLEIIERPANAAGRIIIIAIALLLIVATFWACLAKLDVVVTGTGTVTTDEKMGIVTSSTSGTVSTIFVQEGEFVEKGDILLQLDTENLDLEMQKLQDDMALLEIQRDVMEQYIEDEDAEIHIEDYDENYQYLVNAYVYANELYKAQIEENPDSEELLRFQYLQNLAESLANVEASIDEITINIEEMQYNIENMTITAMTSGYVFGLNVFYEGQEITATQTLMAIVSEETPYVFQGYFADRDMAELAVGDVARLKLSAFSYSDYGAIDGTVTYISPIASNVEGMGNVYQVNIAIDPDHLNTSIDLLNGLSGTAEIYIGKRSVMEYFLEPVTEGLGNSLREK